MTIYSISDLHLSDGNKPMDVFGVHWANHFDKIRRDWEDRVSPGDAVLLPGDLSWAMQLDEALPHLRALGELPGRKVIIKGNHDYWWSGVSRLREVLPPSVTAIQNDCAVFDGVIFAGSRGWLIPGPESAKADIKIYERELIRLEMSLKAARKISADCPIVCMTHYPPLTCQQTDTEVTALLESYSVLITVYGHLHGQSLKNAFNAEHNGVSYKCVSCDGLDFKLARVLEV